MGVGNHVTGSEHARYEQRYAFYTTKGVGRLLKDMHKLKNRAYERGDIAAIDITIDLDQALQVADLTDKQRTAINLLYVEDMEQQKAAELLGIDNSTLSRNRKAALKKIAQVFQDWDYIG